MIAAEFGIDLLLYVAFVFLAFGTWNGFLLTVQTGLYFVGQNRSRVIFALNAMVHAGGLTYLGLWAIAEFSGANLTVIASGYLSAAVLLFGGAMYFWNVAVSVAEDENENSINSSSSHNIEELTIGSTAPKDGTTLQQGLVQSSSAYVLVADRPPLQQLTSKPALFVANFHIIHMVTANWTMTTTREFLADLGDDEQNNKYLTIFTLLMPVALVG